MTTERSVELAALAQLSARIGSDVKLVQGSGGNTSIKIGGVLWVKASGTWLADAARREIFVPVDLEGARRALVAGVDKMPLLSEADGSGLRCSIETSLHALMPHPVVLHLHAVNTIAWAVRRDGQSELQRRLSELSWALLPYRRPGLPLSAAVAAATSGRTLDVLILGNHGLVVGGEDCNAAEALMHDVERRLEAPERPAPTGDRARLQALCAESDYRPAGFEECHGLATDPYNLTIATRGSLYPDHVVFLGSGVRTLRADERIADMAHSFAARAMPCPAVMLVPGKGALVRSDLLPGAEALLRCLAFVIGRLPLDAVATYLPEEEERALLDWDAEHYRKAIAKTGEALVR